jgi:predicted SAM-dependent methyltransferase
MTNTLVFAPDTLVRFRNGQILIHTTSSAAPAFVTDNAMLTGWLTQFARPLSAAQALQQVGAADRPVAVAALEHLLDAGALIAAETTGSAAVDDTAAHDRSRRHLRTLARSVYDLACDALAFGPDIERQLGISTGIGLERRLMALLAAVDGLRNEFRTRRDGYLERQLSALGVIAGQQDLRLHIGCGMGMLDNWVNIDIHPAPLAMNVLWGLPFADGSAQCVFVSHLLEHLYYPHDARAFLCEIRRVLKPGGIVRIVVPDVEQCIDAYVANDRSFFGSRRETWDWWPENPTRLEDFLAYAGAGTDPGYLFEAHKFGYDFETLSRLMQEAGLQHVERSEFMSSRHPELRVDEISAVAKARYGDRFYSLFVEGQA